jgi:hypothetical protein
MGRYDAGIDLIPVAAEPCEETSFRVRPMSRTADQLGRRTAAAGARLGFDEDALDVWSPAPNVLFDPVDRRADLCGGQHVPRVCISTLAPRIRVDAVWGVHIARINIPFLPPDLWRSAPLSWDSRAINTATPQPPLG